jgi:DNA-binding protein H-NS
MAKTNLSVMSVDALIRLRDEVGAVLKSKAAGLKKELALLGEDFAEIAHIARYGKKKGPKAGRKVAPKYRDKNGNQWAGRGAQPVWLREALKGGAKAEDFLIAKAAPAKKKKTRGKYKKKAA